MKNMKNIINNKVTDERILSEKRRIGNEAFNVLIYMLLASIFIQEYLFKAPFSQYAVEVVCLIVSYFFVIVRTVKSGNDVYYEKKYSQKNVVMGSIVSGLAVAAVTTVLNWVNYDELMSKNLGNTVLISLITFVSSAVLVFVVLELTYIVNKKKQDKIKSELDDNED
ncbi:hypothetical protein SDC9_98475 [bioreactor metagenome]|uniref:DUF3278 domain-containing protein n=1 Tax=bioreactor metagenome TaxID=1076179 RepID=A0A645AQ46_9ZZZZ